MRWLYWAGAALALAVLLWRGMKRKQQQPAVVRPVIIKNNLNDYRPKKPLPRGADMNNLFDAAWVQSVLDANENPVNPVELLPPSYRFGRYVTHAAVYPFESREGYLLRKANWRRWVEQHAAEGRPDPNLALYGEYTDEEWREMHRKAHAKRMERKLSLGHVDLPPRRSIDIYPNPSKNEDET